jgi:hypothetical protein
MLENIPAELRMLPQWVNWRLMTVDGKLTKPPLCPNTLHKADITSPRSCSYFDKAAMNAKQGLATGVGFVFTPVDPYTGIDLDNKDNDPAKEALFKRIINDFDSYTEVSPSGKGVHIIVRGRVPRGLKRHGVEIYSVDRYFTMTGNIVRNRPIANAQFKLEQLWEELGGNTRDAIDFVGGDETISDETLLNMAANAENGPLFRALWAGHYQDLYPSHSEADLALTNIIAFYTDNAAQIMRLFRQSELGKRDKAQRDDYLKYNIKKAFDQKLDTTHIKAALAHTVASLQTAPVITSPDAQPVEIGQGMETNVTAPPGLMGELMRFVYEASPRPVPHIALAAAIGFMSGTGRAWNVSGTGLNMYTLCVAPSGSGKEMIAGGINKIIGEYDKAAMVTRNLANPEPPKGARTFIGPSEIASGAGVIRWLSEGNRSFVSIIGEFGIKLRQISADNASSADSSLLRTMLDLYAKSGAGSTLNPSAYSDKKNNTELVFAPSFSFIGETTPSTLYGAINENMILNGLLPRILTITYEGKRVPENLYATHAVMQDESRARLVAFVNASLKHVAQNTVCNINLTPEAQALSTQLSTECDIYINSDNREVGKTLWNRTHLKVLKLAALVAVGCNPLNPVVAVEHLHWAKSIVFPDTIRMIKLFDNGAFGNRDESDMQRETDVCRAIVRYLSSPRNENEAALAARGVITHTRLAAAVYPLVSFAKAKQKEARALKETIDSLATHGIVGRIAAPVAAMEYQTKGVLYAVIDLPGVEIKAGTAVKKP